MSFSSTFEIPEEKYWELKAILEAEHGKEFPIENVREIADNLIEFYAHLAYLHKKYPINNPGGIEPELPEV